MVTQGIFGQYAWQYYRAGWNVLPVHNGQYHELPYAKWYTERQDEDDAGMLCDQYSESNQIAVVMGTEGIAVDVDVREEDIGSELFKELMSVVPPSPMKRFGSKGIAALYSGMNFSFANSTSDNPYRKNSQTGGTPLECGMGLLTLPPSVHHKSGGIYRWVEPFEMTNREDLPILTQQAWLRLEAFCQDNKITRQGMRIDANQVSGDGRYYANSKYIWTLVNNPSTRALSQSKIIDRLIAWDREQHAGDPWYSDKNDNGRNPRKKAEYFLKKALAKKAKKEGVIIVPASEWTEPEELYVEPVAEAKPASGLIPKGGLMEEVARLVESKSGGPNEVQALSACLGLCSILAAHRVIVGTMPANLYVLCTAPSGSGKQAPQDVVKEALLASNRGSEYIGAGAYASKEALTAGLKNNRCRIDNIDECKNMFMANSRGDSSLSGIDAELCALYTSSNGLFQSKLALGEKSKRPQIMCPYLTLMLYSTVEAFHRYYDRMLAEEGFGGRTIFLYDDGARANESDEIIGFGPIAARSELSKMALDKINYWLDRETKYLDKHGRVCDYIGGGGRPQYLQIPMRPDAYAVFKEYQKEYKAKWAAVSKPGETDYELRANFKRAIEQHIKLMTCWVISQGDEFSEIGMEALEWAHKVFEFSLESQRRMLAGKAMASDMEEKLTRYKVWAKGKVDVDMRRLREWVRRMLGDQKNPYAVSQFIELLKNEGYGEVGQKEVSGKSSNRLIKEKWIFNAAD